MGIRTGHFYANVNGTYVDLSKLAETNHGGASIENLRLGSYFSIANNSTYPIITTAYPATYIEDDQSVGFLSGNYIDLSLYFNDELLKSTSDGTTWNAGGIYRSGSKALLAGYLPLSPSAPYSNTTKSYCTKSYTDNRSGSRTYKFIRSASNNELSIKYLDKPFKDISSSAVWKTATTWLASDFPNGVIPYRIYVQIQAGGGGGGNRSGGGGGGYWAGVISTTAGTLIQMGPSGAAATNATDSYIMDGSGNTLITIAGGKAGSSSTGGTGGAISYGVNNGGKYTSYAWTSKAISGAKGGDDSTGAFDGVGNNGGSVSNATWNIAGGYLGSYTNHTKLAGQSGGALQDNWGGSGGGASFMGDGGKGGAGNFGDKTIYNYGVTGGPGLGGGGGGKGNATDSGATGGNWWISISY